MMTLRQLSAEPPMLPTRTAWFLTELVEARGRQELFTHQSPQKLQVLREHVLIDGAGSSNRIEGEKELEQRVGQIRSPRGEKTAAVAAAIERQIGDFRVADLQAECPGGGVDLIRKVLARLQKEQEVQSQGRGRSAKWHRIGN